MKCPVPKLVLPLLLVLAVALWSPAEGRSASGAAVEAAEAEGAARLSDQQWADDEEALLLSLLRQRAAAQAEKRGFRNSLRFGSNYGRLPGDRRQRYEICQFLGPDNKFITEARLTLRLAGAELLLELLAAAAPWLLLLRCPATARRGIGGGRGELVGAADQLAPVVFATQLIFANLIVDEALQLVLRDASRKRQSPWSGPTSGLPCPLPAAPAGQNRACARLVRKISRNSCEQRTAPFEVGGTSTSASWASVCSRLNTRASGMAQIGTPHNSTKRDHVRQGGRVHRANVESVGLYAEAQAGLVGRDAVHRDFDGLASAGGFLFAKPGQAAGRQLAGGFVSDLELRRRPLPSRERVDFMSIVAAAECDSASSFSRSSRFPTPSHLNAAFSPLMILRRRNSLNAGSLANWCPAENGGPNAGISSERATATE
uniref:Uncharacterized protein n=4 Tax=Macrostomum lignano TaxID=282301 RepID=A0A1I8IWI9_9PLAT